MKTSDPPAAERLPENAGDAYTNRRLLVRLCGLAWRYRVHSLAVLVLNVLLVAMALGGLGITLGPLVAPHDGTVSVEETRLDGISDHHTVAASHTGLLFSSEVADLTLAFLRDGCFVPSPRG